MSRVVKEMFWRRKDCSHCFRRLNHRVLAQVRSGWSLNSERPLSQSGDVHGPTIVGLLYICLLILDFGNSYLLRSGLFSTVTRDGTEVFY
ncbi:hypothetical protein TNCT_248871 [Trichonephila clavata]|uniref:Uncharacterized protein n=1 Tax=Trichonephila clavata TaxID=2740835 RepID=A0A8X6KXP4_TRICU|nr:hypothetical protein TNCT_248871 [Trichonephila clavata]